jgi:glycosyltransferase involved in cell wall biosynthesis
VKVMMWAADALGQGFWRMQVPGYALERAGHEVCVSQIFAPGWQASADVVVGARTAEPKPSKVWAQLAAEGRTLLFDVDDDYLNVDPSNEAAHAYFGRPDIRAALLRNMGLATRITCVSPRLADVYAEYGDTVVVPNGLPAEVLAWPRPRTVGKVVIGWAGSTSTLPELRLIAGRLRRFLDRYHTRHPADYIEVHTVGVQQRDLHAVGLRHPYVRVTPWVESGYPYLRAIDFDVWLAPYRPTGFNRAKAPTKAIEAAFLGVPIIASDIDPYAQFIQHGVTGFVCTRDHDWDTYLAALVENDTLRQRMGGAAWRQAHDHTAEQFAARWEHAAGLEAGALC